MTKKNRIIKIKCINKQRDANENNEMSVYTE